MEEKDGFFGLTTPTPKRHGLKSQSHFNTYLLWKQKLRENCYKRVREDRNRLLWKMRSPVSESLGGKELISSAFREIVSDELKKIKDSSLYATSKISNASLEVDDVLWEYDGLHDAYQGECEEMMLEMQRIFYEDLRAEPTGTESENYIETWGDEEDEYLACAVFEHMKLNDEQMTTTWCPICKLGVLKEDNKHIRCNLCELQLCKCDEVNLDKLRTRLAEAHMEHLDRGCKSKPKFCVETRFCLTALYISCKDCSIFEVVM